MIRINILTIFPGFFAEPLSLSILGRSAQAGLTAYRVVDLREYAEDRHKTVDDEPYGGGAGMVMKPEPFFEAVDDLRPEGPVVLMSARGPRFRHGDAVSAVAGARAHDPLRPLQGRDQRVADHLATEELSLGPFVVSGGEVAALAVTDAVVRLLPGALGDHESASSDSFYDGGALSAPSYTRRPSTGVCGSPTCCAAATTGGSRSGAKPSPGG